MNNGIIWFNDSFSISHLISEYILLQVQNTYYLPYDERIPKEHETRENIGYYQWVGFFLCVQAICFYLPRTLWGLFNTKAGKVVASNIYIFETFYQMLLKSFE